MSFYKESGIDAGARTQDRKLQEALERARIPRRRAHRDSALLEFATRDAMLAVNQFSRRLWGQATCEQLSAHFSLESHDFAQNQDIFLVTIVDVSCATAATAGSVNVRDIRRKLRSGLKKRSHLGFIEPAYYVNVQAGSRAPGRRCIFWHLHALLWGMSTNEVKRLVRELSRRHVAIADDFPSVQARKIAAGELPATVGYLMKMPANAYRLWRRRWDRQGRPLDETIARFGQSKGELRPGERVALFHAMKDLRLGQLAIAGGEGSQLLARAKYAVGRTLRREKPQRRAPRR